MDVTTPASISAADEAMLRQYFGANLGGLDAAALANEAALLRQTGYGVAQSESQAALAEAEAALAATQKKSDMMAAFDARAAAFEAAQGDRFGLPYALTNPLDYYAAFGTVPVLSIGKSAFGYDSDPAKSAKLGNEGVKYLTPTAGSTYTLYSPRSGKTLGTATTPEELAALAQQATSLTDSKGLKADWQILQSAPGAAEPTVVASDYYTPNVSTFGKIAGMALPIATSFIPGLNVLATMGVQALSGAAGAAMAGRDPLKAGLISGLTAGALKGSGLFAPKTPLDAIPGLQKSFDAAMQGLQDGVSQGIGAGLTSSAADAALKKAANTAFEEAANEIVVKAARALPSALKAAAARAAVARAAGAAAAQAVANGTLGAGNAPAQQPQNPTISDDGNLLTVYGNVSRNALAGGATLPNILGQTGLSAISNLAQSGASGADRLNEISQQAQPDNTTTGNDIVVTADKSIPFKILEALTAGGAGLGNLTSGVDTSTATGQTEPAETTSTGDKIVAGAKLASLLAGVLGGGSGSGSSSGSPGKIPAGLGGGLGEVFSKPLPTANLPGLTTGTTGARTAADLAGQGLSTPQDYYRYGYGPEQSFFNYVPQGAKNTSTAYTGYEEPQPLARGGQPRGKAKGALSYDDLTPEEKNFVDYHRRSLAINPLEHDGSLTTVYGMLDDVPGGVMLHPGYIHGRMINPRDRADRQAATDWARGSGIAFPVYPDIGAADARETAIHRDIIEPDAQRYQRGDRSFLQGYASGGQPRGKGKPLAVKGPGTGRSDDIPAVLSDGEYVMDAETVAMLGDGSNEAGAKKLDQFRVNIRKHKGRKLAKGALSANAKAPERYLAGGRS